MALDKDYFKNLVLEELYREEEVIEESLEDILESLSDEDLEVLAEAIESGEIELTEEEIEQLDELSRKTLANYVIRNAEDRVERDRDMRTNKDNRNHLYQIGSDSYRNNNARKAVYDAERELSKDNKEMERKQSNRRMGMYKAARRLAKEDIEQIDELSGKTLGSYIQKARADIDAKRQSQNAVDNDPSVKRWRERRSKYYDRKEYTASGKRVNRDQIDNTFKRESEARRKIDPDYDKKLRTRGRRYNGIEKAVKKLQSGKLTD